MESRSSREMLSHDLFGGSGPLTALNDVPSYPAKMMKVKVRATRERFFCSFVTVARHSLSLFFSRKDTASHPPLPLPLLTHAKVSTPTDSLPVSHPLRKYNVPPRTLMCSSCQKSRANMRYNPCGHVVVCDSCNPGIGGWCTWCNLTIQGFKAEVIVDSRPLLAVTRPNSEKVSIPSLLYGSSLGAGSSDPVVSDSFLNTPSQGYSDGYSAETYGVSSYTSATKSKENGGRNRLAYLKQSRKSGAMKRANDLERRVKGFRIPNAWDVYKDER